MNWKFAYKVVAKDHNSLFFDNARYATVNYQRYRVTSSKPHCGPLAVFTNLTDAMLFSHVSSRGGKRPTHIHACRYIPSPEGELYAPTFGARHVHKYPHLLRYPHEKVTKSLDFCPHGTSFASAIKITHHIPCQHVYSGIR